jgi:hypothetical protein
MWNRQLGVLLACLMLGIGCNRSETVATTLARSAHTATASDAPKPPAESTTEREARENVSTVPVVSKELNGVWYGVARDTGVVVQFIGRQSREQNQRGVVSGRWVVHVDHGSVSSAIQFTDNGAAGAVDLAVGLVNNETKKNFTTQLGCVERGSDGVLYLSIYKNPVEPMYVPANRIPLQRVDDQDTIERSAIDQMREALKQMHSA